MTVNPSSADEWYIQASYYVNGPKDYAVGLRSFQKAIDLDPNYALAYVGLADATLRLSDYSSLPVGEALAKAEPLAKKALQLDDRLGEAYATIGAIDGVKGDVASESAAFDKAIELNPNYAMAYMWYSQAVGFADQEKSLALLQKALELDPLSPPVNSNMGFALLAMGRAEEAVERFRRAVEIEPSFSGGYRGLAKAYADALNQPEEAIRYARKAIEADPGNLALRVGLAEGLASMGRSKEAIAECNGMIDQHPDYAPAYLELSFILETQGRLDEAVRWARKSVDLDPASLQGSINLFVSLLNLGDEASASRVQKRMAANESSALAGSAFLENLEVYRGELKDAEKRARSLMEILAFVVRDDVWMFDMRAGRIAEARELYRSSFSELYAEAGPRISADNLNAAINVGAAALKLGDRPFGEKLLRASEVYIASRTEGTRRARFRFEPVQINAIMGKKEEAIAAFRHALDDGYRTLWWRFPADPNLDSIRDDPRFVAMMKELRADVDKMRAAAPRQASGA
jgi:tetratricopeptide (TPR) repeat protein